MLYAKQDQRIVQRIKLLMLRTREQQGGTGIFYNTDLRRQVLIPEDPRDWGNPALDWAAAAGLSSKIGGEFSHIPAGMKPVHLYGMLGTVVDTDQIVVPTVEGDEVGRIDPNGLTCSFEILAPDALFLQEQNQMALLIEMDAFVQFNAQDYGQGFDPDGRDREILRGSLWAVPQFYQIGFSRPELKSAAASAQEIQEIAERAREKNAQRALSAREESFANRATRDNHRAMSPMPPRRGTNTAVQIYGGSHFGTGTQGVPWGGSK